jgi:hypothetical protein
MSRPRATSRARRFVLRWGGRGVAALVVASACAPVDDVERWEGDLVTLTSSQGVRPCAGTLDFYDRYASGLSRSWSSALDPDQAQLTVDLRAEDPATGAGGRADVIAARAWSAFETSTLHELTHLVIGYEDGGSAPPIMEGVAEAFGTGDRATRWWPSLYPAEEFFFQPLGVFDATDYRPAGHFVSFLIRRYGIAQLREAYRAVPLEATAVQIEDGLLGVYGEDLYIAIDEFDAADSCPSLSWECGGEVVEAQSLPLSIEPTLGCEDPRALGAVAEGDGNWFPEFLMTFEVTTEPAVRIVLENAVVRIEPCAFDCEALPVPPFPTFSEGDDGIWPSPPAGRYVLSVRPIDPLAPFGGSLQAAD